MQNEPTPGDAQPADVPVEPSVTTTAPPPTTTTPDDSRPWQSLNLDTAVPPRAQVTYVDGEFAFVNRNSLHRSQDGQLWKTTRLEGLLPEDELIAFAETEDGHVGVLKRPTPAGADLWLAHSSDLVTWTVDEEEHARVRLGPLAAASVADFVTSTAGHVAFLSTGSAVVHWPHDGPPALVQIPDIEDPIGLAANDREFIVVGSNTGSGAWWLSSNDGLDWQARDPAAINSVLPPRLFRPDGAVSMADGSFLVLTPHGMRRIDHDWLAVPAAPAIEPDSTGLDMTVAQGPAGIALTSVSDAGRAVDVWFTVDAESWTHVFSGPILPSPVGTIVGDDHVLLMTWDEVTLLSIGEVPDPVDPELLFGGWRVIDLGPEGGLIDQAGRADDITLTLTADEVIVQHSCQSVVFSAEWSAGSLWTRRAPAEPTLPVGCSAHPGLTRLVDFLDRSGWIAIMLVDGQLELARSPGTERIRAMTTGP